MGAWTRRNRVRMRGRSGVDRGSFRGRSRVEWDVLFGEKCLFCSDQRVRSGFFTVRAGGERILRESHDQIVCMAGSGWMVMLLILLVKIDVNDTIAVTGIQCGTRWRGCLKDMTSST
jgi:hypothetical protein